ncbi:subtilisin-like protease [Phtheirospermum japonicum]|uniref:Subtilisin-like protease n=1 Tax=Phtheirospermum japonicum TaxID=374723 RepID=A0A830CDY3_9LAMI|nr:subtilisin-like protease [Phtheirospermum japonicum]
MELSCRPQQENSGPNSYTVGNVAPWLMTVAASSTDRSFLAQLRLGDGQIFSGASLFPGKPTKQLPLVTLTFLF